ncbi:MAG: YitT family protein [Proteobacteria bacterium]|nr:YitT family protein [Pseudomonadota bacterium]MBU1610397.1 YitT family protein [Pseudomonadota bacterium]
MIAGKDFSYSIWWNLTLITAGSFLFALGAKGAIEPHGLITGGITGIALLFSYTTDLDVSLLYALLNIPLFVLGWKVSRRFLLYSIYGMLMITLCLAVIHVDFHIKEQLYAAVAGGMICGAGAGLMLRSLGSGGGLDVVSVWLMQKYNIGPGKTSFVFNGLLFACALIQMDVDLIIASFIQMFVSVATMEYVLSIFNQRKMVLVISDHAQEIANSILYQLKRGTTLLNGQGAYSGQAKQVLMTVINNIQLKRLEEIVFTQDPEALFIVENTFNVLGAGFSKRKIY